MKVLLAGATGQLGKALRANAPDAHDLVATSRAEFDLSDAAGLRRVIEQERPDLLINAAAYTAVDKAEGERGAALAVNADAVKVMAQTMDAIDGTLVHISTDFVFDGNASRAYRPGDERNPLSVYGQSKALGEDHLRAEDLLVRTSWVYSAGGANFVTTMLRLMRERNELGIVADQIGCPTFASGLAQVIWGLVEKGSSGTYHHSDAGVASWYDFAVAIAEEAMAIGLLNDMPRIRPISTADYPTPAVRPKFSLLDGSATLAELGREAEHWRINLRMMLKEEAALG